MTASVQSWLRITLFAAASILLANGADLGSQDQPPWDQREAADAATKKEITLAVGAVQRWWAMHRDGFPRCRLLAPTEDWRRVPASFFAAPKSKGIAFSAWNADRSGYWWAVRENRERGPWKISAPQEDGFTFEWSVGVDSEKHEADLVEVRLVYPCKVIM